MYALIMIAAAVTTPPSEAPTEQPKPKPLPPGVVQVQVGTLHCPSCAKQIARNLYKTPGVMRVKTDMKQNLIWVTVQPKKKVSLAKVWAATKLKDVQPEKLRVGDRQFVAKDFEKLEKQAQAQAPAPAATRR